MLAAAHRGDDVRVLLDRAARPARPAAGLLHHAHHLRARSPAPCDAEPSGPDGCSWPAPRPAARSSRRGRSAISFRRSSLAPIWLARAAARAGSCRCWSARRGGGRAGDWRRRGTSRWRGHGTGYLESFFVGDNLERFATSRFNDPRPALVLSADRRSAACCRGRRSWLCGWPLLRAWLTRGAGCRHVTLAADRLGGAAARRSSRSRSASSRATSCRSCRRWRCCSRRHRPAADRTRRRTPRSAACRCRLPSSSPCCLA